MKIVPYVPCLAAIQFQWVPCVCIVPCYAPLLFYLTVFFAVYMLLSYIIVVLLQGYNGVIFYVFIGMYTWMYDIVFWLCIHSNPLCGYTLHASIVLSFVIAA